MFPLYLIYASVNSMCITYHMISPLFTYIYFYWLNNLQVGTAVWKNKWNETNKKLNSPAPSNFRLFTHSVIIYWMSTVYLCCASCWGFRGRHMFPYLGIQPASAMVHTTLWEQGMQAQRTRFPSHPHRNGMCPKSGFSKVMTLKQRTEALQLGWEG